MTELDDLELEPMPEGEEQAPPLTHTMAIVRWVLFGGMCLFALVMVLGYFGMTPWASNGESAQQYHCPMHPTYVSGQPGDCPICGMSLVPIGDNTATESVDMSHAGDAWMRETQAKHGQYGCPMDPEVVSDTAGRCPICNMFLVKVDTTNLSGAGHDMHESNVPGLISVAIEPERLQLIGLKTMVAARRVIDEPAHLVGYVTPDETRLANVQVRASGWVQELHVDQTGQRVERGQKLLTFYSPELAQAWQEYDIARRGEGISSDSAMSQLRSEVAKAARERLLLLGITDADIKQGLAQGTTSITIRSPFTGYVLEKSVQQGQYISPGQSLMTIADLSRVWIIAEVYERDLSRIKVGAPVHVSVSGETTEDIAGVVAYVYPTVSGETRTTRIRVEADNDGLKLRPGMYAQVEALGSAEPVLAIPADAVMDGGEAQYAFVVYQGAHFVPRILTIGRRGDDWVEVLAGVSEGETVAMSANFLIDSESRLQAAIAGMGKTAQPAHQH